MVQGISGPVATTGVRDPVLSATDPAPLAFQLGDSGLSIPQPVPRLVCRGLRRLGSALAGGHRGLESPIVRGVHGYERVPIPVNLSQSRFHALSNVWFAKSAVYDDFKVLHSSQSANPPAA